MTLITNERSKTSLGSYTITSDRKVFKQPVIAYPLDLSEESTKSSLSISSVTKAALVMIGTIGGYYAAKTTNIFSYFLGSKNPKDVNNSAIVKVENEVQPLAIRNDLEKVDQARSLFNVRRSYDDTVEFEEIEVEEFEDLPQAERREGGRRSITIQNPISDQTVIVGELFELTINGATIFNSNTIFVSATKIPTWVTSSSVYPTLIGSYNTHGSTVEIAISGNYAYIADITFGLQIIDISDPANPTFKSSYNTPDQALGISISGNYAYVADGNSGLQIIGITDPANSTFIGSYDTLGYAYGITLSGNYTYVADGNSGLQIIDVTDPVSPAFKGSYNTPDSAKKVTLSGNYAYVADYDSGLQIIDISNPVNSTFIGSYNTPGLACGVAISGNYAYVADYASGLQIIDISDPANPTFKGSYNTPKYTYDVEIVLSGSYAYLAAESGSLQIIDISDPANPTFKSSYDTSGDAEGIALLGNYAYVVNSMSGLQIIKTNLDKLNIFGTPSSLGTYRVDIEGCNEINECITDSFNIIVTDSPYAILIIGISVLVDVCAIGICSGIIGGIIALMRCRKKNDQYTSID